MAHLYRTMAIAALLLPVILHAQERITAQPVSPSSVPSLSNVFKKYALFEINTTTLDRYVKKAATQGDILLMLDLTGYATFPITMHQHDILSAGYKLVVSTPQGRQELPKPDCMTYAGILTGQGNSDVRLTITTDFLYGMLSGNNKSWFIEPVRNFNDDAKENLYVIYETTDVILQSDISCGVTEIMTRKVTANSTARVEGSATGTCKLVELAIASDDGMYLRYKTARNVQQHNIGVVNTMVGIFSNTQLASEYLEFIIAGQYVSTTLANNALLPVTTDQNARVLLDNFTDWGNAGNFGFTYDIGVYWTTTDIATTSPGTIGIAWIGQVCTSYRYQVLEDFRNGRASGLELGLLAAHETAHNLGADHDAGNGYIMAIALSTANTTFSGTSINAMNTVLGNSATNCLSLCNVIQPVAQFNATIPNICTGGPITFTNHSVGVVTGVSWTFPGGAPATSTDQAPVVTYSSGGYKTATLTATSANGTSTVTKEIFVSSGNIGNGCHTVLATNSNNGIIRSFVFQDIGLYNQLMLGDYYRNYSCTQNTILQPGTTYSVNAAAGYSISGTNVYTKFQLFIDYNNDGDFLDASEAVYTSPSAVIGDINFMFTTPAIIPAMDTYLRLRIVGLAAGMANSNGCAIPGNSNIYDFAVLFSSSVSLPLLLTSFDGYYSNGKNELNWKTETEVNTDHFVVERSFNGTDYVEVGNVPAKGLTGNLINYYQFTDGLINADNFNRFYYRLKMVDKDGAYKYSKLVITTRPDEGNVQVLVYPNPVSRNATLQIKKADNNMSVIEVFNSMGQRVYTKRMTANLYNTSIDIPANWSPGIYMIRVSDSKASWSRAVMVK